MNYQLVQTLMEKIDKKHIVSILKRSYSSNKAFRIPGFAKIQNVPLQVLGSQIKQQPLIAREFLLSTFFEFAPMVAQAEAERESESETEEDNEQSITFLKEQVTTENRLGMIALFLLKETEESEQAAAYLLESYDDSAPEPDDSTQLPVPSVDPEALNREKEKIKKLKLKYSEIKKERDELRTALKELQQSLVEIQIQAETMEKEWENAKQTLAANAQSLCEKDEKIASLRREIDTLKSNERKMEKQQKKNVDVLILALGCENCLDKYRSRLHIDYTIPENESLEDCLGRYREIWVAPGTKFGLRRQLQRHKVSYPIYFFHSLSDLLVHVGQFCKQ